MIVGVELVKGESTLIVTTAQQIRSLQKQGL
jgi:hypothetical protein